MTDSGLIYIQKGYFLDADVMAQFWQQAIAKYDSGHHDTVPLEEIDKWLIYSFLFKFYIGPAKNQRGKCIY